VGAEYNAQTTLPGIPAMVMACVKPVGTKYAMFVHRVATEVLKMAQMCSWWHEETTRIDTAQRDADSPHGYNSVVDELSQRLFSSLTLYSRFSQR